MFEHIFRQFPALKDVLNEPYLIGLYTLGSSLIALSFFILGMVCVRLARYRFGNEEKGKKRIIVTQLFGFFLMCCGVSRAIGVVCLYYNFAYIHAYIALLAGILATIALLYIPAVLKESKAHRTFVDVEQKLESTNQKLEQIKDISDKLNTS